MTEHFIDAPHRHGAERANGAGGERVDANFLFAKFKSEVAGSRFQGRFGDTHDVIAGDDFFTAQIS